MPGEASWMRVFFSILHQPAPWQLKTPTTPEHLFAFQILSKLTWYWTLVLPENRGQIKKEIWTSSWLTNLVPSLAGSTKRQSIVGRPGSRARRTDPSGRTNFFKSSKLWLPGLSLFQRTRMRFHSTKYKPMLKKIKSGGIAKSPHIN